MPPVHIVETAPGAYVVDVEGRLETVYVAGPPDNRWAFWNGQIFHVEAGAAGASSTPSTGRAAMLSLTSPMPATVVRILVKPGTHVARGDTVVVLEAMKMELPIRAASDGTVDTVNCSEGELVGADQTLVIMK